ncbi:MAG: hypothetical protein ACHQIM_17230 [Sphingobacteriales bacterium]
MTFYPGGGYLRGAGEYGYKKSGGQKQICYEHGEFQFCSAALKADGE